MDNTANHVLRLHFVKTRSYKKFLTKILSDKLLSDFVIDYWSKSIVFQFQSVAMRDQSFNVFKQSIPTAKVKTTKVGHNYLKIY